MSHSTDHSGASHGSVKTYMTGFILSIILTVIPFWMVMTGAASGRNSGNNPAMAVVQVLVHLVCFLHMNTKSDEGWNMTAFVFTVLIIAIPGCRLHLDYVEPQLQHDDALRAAVMMFKQYLQVTKPASSLAT